MALLNQKLVGLTSSAAATGKVIPSGVMKSRMYLFREVPLTCVMCKGLLHLSEKRNIFALVQLNQLLLV